MPLLKKVSGPFLWLKTSWRFLPLVFLCMMGTLAVFEVTNPSFVVQSYSSRTINRNSDPLSYLDSQESNVLISDYQKNAGRNQAFQQRPSENNLKAVKYKGPERRLSIDPRELKVQPRQESVDNAFGNITPKTDGVIQSGALESSVKKPSKVTLKPRQTDLDIEDTNFHSDENIDADLEGDKAHKRKSSKVRQAENLYIDDPSFKEKEKFENDGIFPKKLIKTTKLPKISGDWLILEQGRKRRNKPKQILQVQGGGEVTVNAQRLLRQRSNMTTGNRRNLEQSTAALSADEVKFKQCKDKMKFKIEDVTQAFTTCSDDVELDRYIAAFKELNRFFRLMGTVFSFVATDIDEKISILESLRSSGAGENYETLAKMTKYESENDLLKKQGFVNGCRTLLRLHRALEFIYTFMLRLSEAKSNDPASKIAQDSYKSTLAKFHPWFLQKGGVLAMYSLPTKRNLVIAVMSESCLTSDKHLNSVMRKMADSAVTTYQRTQKLYDQQQLLDLP